MRTWILPLILTASLLFAFINLMNPDPLWAQTSESSPDPQDASNIIQVFRVNPEQVGDGSVITISEISVSEAIRIELYEEISGSLDSKAPRPIQRAEIEDSTAEGYILKIPEEYRPVLDTAYRIDVFTLIGRTPITAAEVTLEVTPPPQIVQAFEFPANDTVVSDGNVFTITKLHVSEVVDIVIHPEDIFGNPDLNIIVGGEEGVPPGNYEDGKSVKFSANQGPKQNTRYWVGIYVGNYEEEDDRIVTSPKPVLLDLRPVVRTEINPEINVVSKTISLGDLTVAQPVTVTLHGDENNGPEATELASITLVAGRNEDVVLEIPTPYPSTDTQYWLQFFAQTTGTVQEIVPVYYDLPPVIEFDISPSRQVGSGAQITITELVVSEPISVTLHEDIDGVPADEAISRRAVRPGDQVSTKIDIPEEYRPTTEEIYWVKAGEPLDTDEWMIPNPISVTVSVEPETVVKSFEVEPSQESNGKGFVIAELVNNYPVTVTLSDLDGNTIRLHDENLDVDVSSISLEPATHRNLYVKFAKDDRPTKDTVYLLELSAHQVLDTVENPVEFELLYRPDPTVNQFVVATPQVTDTGVINIAVVDVTQDVTITLHGDSGGSPAIDSIDQITAPEGSSQGLSLQIPSGSPDKVTRYWIQIWDRTGVVQTAAVQVGPPTGEQPPDSLPGPLLELDFPYQETGGLFAQFDRVQTIQDSWLAIHERDPSGQLVLVGYLQIPAGIYPDGENPPVRVPFDRLVEDGSVLYATLHQDNGVPGLWEYPRFDPPIADDYGIVSEAFVMGRPAIIAHEQTTSGDTVAVDQVNAPRDGWISIHDTTTASLIGHVSIPMGFSRNLQVPIYSELQLGEYPLQAVMHADDGERDVFEFPAGDNVVVYDNVNVSQPLALTVERNEDPTPVSIPSDEATLSVPAELPLNADNSITIPAVGLPVDGWVIVYLERNGIATDLCGALSLDAGDYRNVKVFLQDPPLSVDTRILVRLAMDNGQYQVFEPLLDKAFLSEDNAIVQHLTTVQVPQ